MTGIVRRSASEIKPRLVRGAMAASGAPGAPLA